MFFKVASDISLAIHLVFVLFVIFGGIFVFKWKRMLFFHLPCLLWGCCIEFFGWICPLTPLENYFRQKAGGLVYADGANMNALLGQTKIGHLGFDVMHLNLQT